MSRLEHLTQVSRCQYINPKNSIPTKKVILAAENRNLFPNVEYNNKKWQPCSNYVEFNNIMDASTPNGHLKFHYMKIIVRLKTCRRACVLQGSIFTNNRTITVYWKCFVRVVVNNLGN